MENGFYIGMAAAILTTLSFIPQAIKTIRSRQTRDISLWMYSGLNVGLVLWLVYGVMNRDIPMMMANGVTLVFTVTVLIMKIRHG